MMVARRARSAVKSCNTCTAPPWYIRTATRSAGVNCVSTNFRAAVKAAPEWVEAWINLSAELAATGQLDDARQAAATALRLEPANPVALKLSDQLAHDPRAQQAKP